MTKHLIAGGCKPKLAADLHVQLTQLEARIQIKSMFSRESTSREGSPRSARRFSFSSSSSRPPSRSSSHQTLHATRSINEEGDDAPPSTLQLAATQAPLSESHAEEDTPARDSQPVHSASIAELSLGSAISTQPQPEADMLFEE